MIVRIQFSRLDAPSRVLRPPVVYKWMRSGRSLTPPAIKLKGFEKRWWNWWVGSNPEWRTRENGRTVPGGSQNGSLKILARRGPAGFSLFVVTLTWWYPRAEEESFVVESWTAAMKDVSWVLKKILSQLENARSVHHLSLSCRGCVLPGITALHPSAKCDESRVSISVDCPLLDGKNRISIST